MDIPDSLRERMELYQASGWLARERAELFGEASWLAVLEGQHVHARSYSPLVDTLPREELEKVLRDIREVLAQCATSMPDHDEFISQHCAAIN